MLADPATEDGRVVLTDLFDAFDEDMRSKIARLRAAIRARDAVAVRKLAHEQKGASGMVGAAGLAGLFLAIERAASDPDAAETALARVEEGLARLDAEVREFIRRSVTA